jgi:uncharacterized repeat protein (TIGR01451 family)
MGARVSIGSTLRPVLAAIASLTLLLASVLSILPAYGAIPPEPTYGSATVDGSYAEWDLTNDFFADMYRAGDPNKKVESKLYVRYDCATQTLYVLVLAVDGVPVLPQPDDAFVKLGNATKLVDGNSGNNGTPPDFAWIMEANGLAQVNGTYIGFEASASLAPGNYANLNVHVQVYDDDESQTSAVADRAILLDILCTPEADIKVEKSALEVNITPPATLHYEYQVTNPGQIPLTNVTVTDDKCDNVQFKSGDNSPPNGELDPGETWLYTCEFLYDGPGRPGECVVNTVLAKGNYDGQRVDDDHVAVVHCAEPPEGGIQILKTVNLEHVCPGQTLIYRYEVTALGDQPLANVTVSDDTCSPIQGPSGDENLDSLLDPDEVWIYTCRYTVTGAEPNPLENRAIAKGVIVDGASVEDRHPAIVEIVPCVQVEEEFVPEPSSALLLAGGLAGMAGYARLRWRRKSRS